MTRSLQNSWAISLRHLAASRYFLPIHLGDTEAKSLWAEIDEFLHHNEFGLALDNLELLGNHMGAPAAFWNELLLASKNMGLTEHAARIQTKL